MNALDSSGGPPPAPQPNPQMAQQPGGAPGGMPQGAQAGGGPAAQKPAPTHAQTVAALRHFQAFEHMYEGFLKRPDVGKSNLKSTVIDGVVSLVSNRFISTAQAVMLLGSFPQEPLEQRKWIQEHYQRDRQAADAVIDHHRAAHVGTQDMDVEHQETSDPDNHMEDINGMMGAHYQGGKDAPPPEVAIGAKQALRGFAEGGRPTPGQPAIVGEQGPEVFVPDQPGTIVPNDQANALFMQSGMQPTPPYAPPLTRAVPGYEDIDPNELAMMRHREMVRPQAGRADIPMEHIVNALHAAGGVAAAPALMAASSYLAPEALLARAAASAPHATRAALALGGTAAASQAGEQEDFKWSDPNPERVKEMDAIQKRIDQRTAKITELGTTSTKSPAGTQKATIEQLSALNHPTGADMTRLAKLREDAAGERSDALGQWQARMQSEKPFRQEYPTAYRMLPLAGWGSSALGGLVGARMGRPFSSMLGGALAGIPTSAAAAVGPTAYDAATLPTGSKYQQQAADWLRDPNYWLGRVLPEVGVGMGLGATGGGWGAKLKGLRGSNALATGGSPAPLPGSPSNALASPSRPTPKPVFDKNSNRWRAGGQFAKAPGSE